MSKMALSVNVLAPAFLLLLVQGNPFCLQLSSDKLRPTLYNIYLLFMVARSEAGQVHTCERGCTADKQRGEGWGRPGVWGDGAEPVWLCCVGRDSQLRRVLELVARRPEAFQEGGQWLPRRWWQPDPERSRGSVPVRLGPCVRDSPSFRARGLLWTPWIHHVIQGEMVVRAPLPTQVSIHN